MMSAVPSGPNTEFALLQCDRSVQNLDYNLATGRNMQVGHVTSVMALGCHHPMLFPAWIEVTTRRSERRLAFSNTMHMECVLASR